MKDLNRIANLKNQFSFSYADENYITRYLSNRSGDAAAENTDLASMITKLEFKNKAETFGVHVDNKNNRKGLDEGLSMLTGERIDLQSLLTMPKGKYEQTIGYLKRSTVLPESLHLIFSNTPSFSLSSEILAISADFTFL